MTSSKKKKCNQGDSDSEESKGDGNSATKKKQNIERVAVNLAENQNDKFLKLTEAFESIKTSPAITEYKTTSVFQPKSEIKDL